tara:strand:- start:987 stop:2672 length:1686 start_codon:yes stop_codon:yes gene_type:complete
MSCSNEEIPLISQDEIRLRDNNEDLKNLSLEFAENIYQPHPDIVVAVGYGLANSIMIIGEKENFVIDTMGGIETAEKIINDFTSYSDNPISTIVYTHFHADHTLGAQAFLDRYPNLDVISHEDTVEEFEQFFGIKRDIIGTRSGKMFGLILKNKDKAETNGIGIKLEAGIDTPGYVKPNITFDEMLTMEISGKSVDFYHAPGETDDQLFVWIEEMKALFPGDNIYKAFPNIYTIRGTSYRSFRSWYKSIEKMISLEPEILVPSHGKPITGKEKIKDILSTYRDAIKYVHDQTMRYLNMGFSPTEASQMVRLPENLSSDPYLYELYGTVEWSSRNLFNGYFGWFDGNPTNLYPFTENEFNARLLELVSLEKIEEELQKAMDDEDYQWALHLADIAEANNPDKDEYKSVKAKALSMLGDRAYNPNAISYYNSSSAEMTGELADIALLGQEDAEDHQLAQLSIDMFLDVMATRLNPINVEGQKTETKIYFKDLNQLWKLRINNSVFTYEVIKNTEKSDINMDSIIFKKLVSGTLDGLTEILLTNKNADGERKKEFLEFMAVFRD